MLIAIRIRDVLLLIGKGFLLTVNVALKLNIDCNSDSRWSLVDGKHKPKYHFHFKLRP